jgi:hypothetical protein
MQVEKTPKSKTYKQRRNKQANPDIFAAEFVSLGTQTEAPHVEKPSKKKKGSQFLEIRANPIARPG